MPENWLGGWVLKSGDSDTEEVGNGAFGLVRHVLRSRVDIDLPYVIQQILYVAHFSPLNDGCVERSSWLMLSSSVPGFASRWSA
jgi:hypothetical protein